jgi:hypothetical protein
MLDASAFFDAIAAVLNNGSQQPSRFEWGELVTYYPDLHEGVFELPSHPDDITGEPITVGPIPIGTHFTGPGYGAQFPPPIGAQGLLAYMDEEGVYPVVVSMHFNEVETPPFPDGRSWGHVDPAGNSVATSLDTNAPGDGQASAKVFGAQYASQATTSGHKVALDDVLKRISTVSATGHQFVIDDVLKRITTQTVGGLQTIHDDVTNEIVHLAPNISLGARLANMSSVNAALNQSHLTTFEGGLFTQRLNDLIALATAAVAAGTPGAGSWIGLLAELAHVPIPNGSQFVRIAN